MNELRTVLSAASILTLATFSLACGGGGGGGTGGSGGSGGSGASTAGTGGVGGSGGDSGGSGGSTTSAGGSGGSGGSTGGSGGTASAGGSGGSGGSGGNGSGDAKVLLFAGGPDGLLGGEYTPGGSWTTASLDGQTTSEVAITPIGGIDGVLWATAAFRDSVSGLPYSTTWTSNGFSTPVPIGNQKMVGGPGLLSLSGANVVAIQLEDLTYATSYKQGPAMPWVSPEGVISFDANGSPVTSHGPNPPGIGLLEGETAIGFGGDDGDFYHQTPSGLTWTAPAPHAVPGTVEGRPVFAEGLLMTMALWHRKSDGQVRWTSYITFQDWPAPQTVPGVLTKDTPALSYLLTSDYTLAFRGLDGNLYLSVFDSSTEQWSAPELMFGGVAIASSPSLDSGIQGLENDGELAFVTADTGEVFHSSLVNGTWIPPVLVGGTGLKHVAIQAALW